jgi:Tol biopolymer transport system component
MIYSIVSVVQPYLFLILLLLMAGLQPQAWADEYPSPPDADNPAVSPDGRKIVFESYSDNIIHKTTLWIANRDGSDAHPLVDWPESFQTEPDWSPDGKYIIFSSNRSSRERDIWRIDADGNNAVRLTSSGHNEYPRFSPDGTKILFQTYRTPRRELWYMSVDGSDQRTAGLPAEIASEPSWSPDGNALVYSRCGNILDSGSWQDMECNLFTYRLDSGAIKQLTFGKVDDSSPDWGALGIVFTSNRNGPDGIFIVDETGSNLRQITTSNDLDLNPRWDHTTDTIVFASGGNEPNIWSADIHGNETQLTQFGTQFGSGNHPPSANAGADQIVECTTQSGTSVRLDGSGSSDADNDPLTYVWSGQFGTADGPTPIVTLPQGQTTVTLTATDGKGGTASDEVLVNVVDTTPPSILNTAANPTQLWPPNHKMIPIALAVTASDSCSPTTTCRIVSVSSNEPANGLGDGDAAPDWEITGNLEARLRAERAATGNGRAYVVTIQCTDASGNRLLKNAVVTVSQSQSSKQ